VFLEVDEDPLYRFSIVSRIASFLENVAMNLGNMWAQVRCVE
jgi:hypothetical protein